MKGIPTTVGAKLHLRIPAADRDLIDRAAALSGKTRSGFVREAAHRFAEETLFELAVLSLGPQAHAEFIRRLEAPARPNERLACTMRMQAPWRGGESGDGTA